MMHCLVSSENRFDCIYYFSISTYFLFSLYKLIVVLGLFSFCFIFWQTVRSLKRNFTDFCKDTMVTNEVSCTLFLVFSHYG